MVVIDSLGLSSSPDRVVISVIPLPIPTPTPTVTPPPLLEETPSLTPAPAITPSPMPTPSPPSTLNLIKGKVTDSSGMALTDIFIEVFDSISGVFVNFDITDINGNYSIAVPSGMYRVMVDTLGTNFKPLSKEVVIEGLDVEVDFSLSITSFIKGRVTDIANNPIPSITVEAFDFDTGFWMGSGITDEDGDYAIPVMPGDYKVGIDISGTEFAPIFFDDSNWDSATLVTVIEGEDRLNIDFRLIEASFIGGVITDGIIPLRDIAVDVFDFETGTWMNRGETGEDGTYMVAVRPGSYKVAVSAIEQGFEDEFFDDKGFDTADPVRAPDGGIVSGIDFILARGGSISGMVTANGEVLTDIEVNAFEFDRDLWINGTRTVNGLYRIEGLSTARYRLWAFDPKDRFSSQFFNNTSLWSQAIPVSTARGADISNINFALSGGGIVSGKVTDGKGGLNGIIIEAYDANTGLWVGSTDTDDSRGYSLILPVGNYHLRAFDSGSIFSSRYFDNASAWNEASNVPVAGGRVTDIDFTLFLARFISGLVRDDSNKPLKGIKINAFDFDTGVWINSATTDKEGKYRVSLAPGRYRVGAMPEDPLFTPAFFNSTLGNVKGWDRATPVLVTPSEDTKDINFRLSREVGIISGRVKDQAGNLLSRIAVKAYDYDTDQWINEALSDGSGVFNITVPQGRYRVLATPLDAAEGLSNKFYDNVNEWDLATVVNVEGDKTTILNDIIPSPGNVISGKVVLLQDSGTDMTAPLPGVTVDVYGFDTASWINSAVTGKDGEYIISGILKGDYRVKASPPQGLGLAVGFFDGSDNWDAASRVSIDSKDIDGIDFTLSIGGRITGKVSDAETGRPISGIEVDAYLFDTGVWVDHDITDGLGNYLIEVKEGTYLVRTVAKGTDFVDEFFEDAIDIDKARPVTVTVEVGAKADFMLRKGGKILGTVLKADKRGVPGAKVDVFDFNNNSWVNKEISDSNGHFVVAVPLGTYRLRINAPVESNLVDKSLDLEIKVAPPSLSVDIGEIILNEGRGFIEGGVKDSSGELLEGIKIDIFEFDSGSHVRSDFTDVNGEYSIGLTPGSYRVRASSVRDEAQQDALTSRFIDEYFDNALTWGSATAVNIKVGKVQRAEFILGMAGGCISGRVRDGSTLAPIAGVEVHIFQSDRTIWIGSDKTDINGGYSICVPDGTYHVWANPKNTDFIPQFFSNIQNIDRAKNIVVMDKDIGNIDFDLKVEEVKK